MSESFAFLVACTRLYNPLCPSVGRSVTLCFFRRLWAVFTLLLLPNCLVGLFHHCPCQPARDLGSRVYGLVFLMPNCFSLNLNCPIVLPLYRRSLSPFPNSPLNDQNLIFVKMSGVHDIICACINPYQSSLIQSNIAVFLNQF